VNSDVRLALVACFRDENLYLREWLEYHRLVGVGHVYLYDNDGSAAARAITQPFEEEGFVTRHAWQPASSWLYGRLQHQAHVHCIRHYRARSQWLMKIDIDEFLAPINTDDVGAALARYAPSEVRGLCVPRFNFGADGRDARPDDLVIASYLHREATFSNHKDIAATQHLASNRFTQSSHFWRYRPLSYAKRCVREQDVLGLRLHHYYTKSFGEYVLRQNPAGGRAQTRAEFEARNAPCQALLDDSLLRFLPALRARLGAARTRGAA
jgi:hypothetical protein